MSGRLSAPIFSVRPTLTMGSIKNWVKEEGVIRHPMARRSFSAGKGQVEGSRLSGRQCSNACTVERQKGNCWTKRGRWIGHERCHCEEVESGFWWILLELPVCPLLVCTLPWGFLPSSLQLSYPQGSVQISSYSGTTKSTLINFL